MINDMRNISLLIRFGFPEYFHYTTKQIDEIKFILWFFKWFFRLKQFSRADKKKFYEKVFLSLSHKNIQKTTHFIWNLKMIWKQREKSWKTHILERRKMRPEEKSFVKIYAEKSRWADEWNEMKCWKNIMFHMKTETWFVLPENTDNW